MSNRRRDFLKELLVAGTLPGLFGSPGVGLALGGVIDQDAAKRINPEVDLEEHSFWSDFLSSDAKPIVGARPRGRGPQSDDAQPVFLHWGGKDEGFLYAAELDAKKLVPAGDVMIGVNTSTVKIAEQDLKTFQQTQNAQLRIDVAQTTGVLPIIEAMAYTVVGAMRSIQTQLATPSTTSKGATTSKVATTPKAAPTVQNISVSSDAAWQKMQNIPLPRGEGRWALNLEAQKKDSLFATILKHLVGEVGLFVPMIGLPGIVLSGLNSFNNVYGVLHSGTVPIIKGNPVRVFATQDAVQQNGGQGSATGILLHPGSYILVSAAQAPPMSELSKLTYSQGRLVPPGTAIPDLDAAAAESLKNVTYVTFEVTVRPTTLVPSTPAR